MDETRYQDRTDSVELKLQLLAQAHREGRYDLAMSLAESLKDTLSFERQEHADPGEPLQPAERFWPTSELPEPWREWAAGWTCYQSFLVTETAGLERVAEPTEVVIACRADQLVDPYREFRLARVAGGRLVEVPSQVLSVARRPGELRCRLHFRADVPAGRESVYLLFYGHIGAELPGYPSDLKVHGEGYAIDIENQHYLARLSRQMGQLERLTYRREHGQELFAGGPGHGEPPGIDWAHDYATAGHFQKLRITNWSRCPNFEVKRGPLCVEVRRWGFPHSPLHPVFTPSRVHMDVTYTFFADQPWFFKRSEMTVVKDLSIAALRDDEWVFSGFTFTDPLWLDEEGQVHEGPLPEGEHPAMQGLGYFNRDSRDAFVALWLDLSADGFDDLQRWANPMHYYRPHGHCWSRYPVGHQQDLKAGTVLRQQNAYLMAPYFEVGGVAAMGKSRGDVLRGPIYSDDEGPKVIGDLRSRLLKPLTIEPCVAGASYAAATGTLARPGEGPSEAELKATCWAALREVFDAQFYQDSANAYDIGLVYDLRLRGETVTVLVTMPHAGRPIYSFLGDPIRERLLQVEGVREVLIEGTWEPGWQTWRMTADGRRAMDAPWG